jgi:K+-transporting ATPase ATPase C chain
MKIVRPSLAVLGAFTIGAGFFYSLAVTGAAHLAFPARAAGSLVFGSGASSIPGERATASPIGSLLLGQSFSRPDRFHGRPSASGYDPAAGAASQFGPTSAALAKVVEERREALAAENPGAGEPPAELLLSSGSGLDPHISPEAAMYQVPRIAAAFRSTAATASGAPLNAVPDEASLRALISSLTEGRTLGILGEPRVNVLELNLELEKRYAAESRQ